MKDYLEMFLEKIAWKMTVIEPYSITHFVITISVVLVAFFSIRLLQKTSVCKMVVIVGTGVFLFFTEVLKQIFLTYVRGWDYSWSDIPFQLCSVPLYLCLLYPFVKSRARMCMEEFLMTFNFIGAIVAFIEPSSSFTSYWVLTVHAILWHGILLFLGWYLVVEVGRKCKIKQRKWLGFADVGRLYLFLSGSAIVINVMCAKVSNNTANMFFLGPAYPNVIILNTIYEKTNWILTSLAMIGGTEGLAYLWYRGLRYQTEKS